ncbi:hypothetical protein [Virgibacillus senegalensis]|uniref:hypothetical protein n=1 Tax=Virgibacillus senegalensis TaxID=1499679 RepID=UPI00069D9BFA|nr:hypothetical protein [Virgibacillus senegalensis]
MKKVAAVGFTAAVFVYTVMHYITYLIPSETGEMILSAAGLAAIFLQHGIYRFDRFRCHFFCWHQPR